MEFLSFTWEELHNTIYDLSRKISTAPSKYDLMVAIARGGMTIAHVLSDFLGLPVATFTISSYKDMRKGMLSDISYHVGGELHKKNILLVDDISDSGQTFVRGLQHLKEMGGDNVSTASLFIKPWTKYFPDFYVKQTDKWIVFPFEARETIDAVSKTMKKENKSEEEIRSKLKEIKIPDKYINTYFKP